MGARRRRRRYRAPCVVRRHTGTSRKSRGSSHVAGRRRHADLHAATHHSFSVLRRPHHLAPGVSHRRVPAPVRWLHQRARFRMHRSATLRRSESDLWRRRQLCRHRASAPRDRPARWRQRELPRCCIRHERQRTRRHGMRSGSRVLRRRTHVQRRSGVHHGRHVRDVRRLATVLLRWHRVRRWKRVRQRGRLCRMRRIRASVLCGKRVFDRHVQHAHESLRTVRRTRPGLLFGDGLRHGRGVQRGHVSGVRSERPAVLRGRRVSQRCDVRGWNVPGVRRDGRSVLRRIVRGVERVYGRFVRGVRRAESTVLHGLDVPGGESRVYGRSLRLRRHRAAVLWRHYVQRGTSLSQRNVRRVRCQWPALLRECVQQRKRLSERHMPHVQRAQSTVLLG